MTIHQQTADLHRDHRLDTGHDSTAGLTVIALLLALVLGLSAADLQAPKAGVAGGSSSQQTTLDGRGKWGGYLK